MERFWERWKPAARARTQLLLAACLWTGVGAVLAGVGARWCTRASGWWPEALVVGGLTLGAAKGHWILARTARRSAQRILRRGDGTCLGGFFSWRTWLFVLAMMGLGAALRRSDLPRTLVGFLYVAVGTGLLWGSQVFWAEWRGL